MQEVDEFRREKYARDDEHTKAWPLTALGAPPKPMADPRSAPAGAAEAGFYPASEFAVHRSLLGGNDGGLHWPPSLLLSSEHTHPRWRFTSHRRLKNVIVVMEWAPPGAPPPAVALLPPDRGAAREAPPRARLYDREGSGKLGAAALGHALTDALGLLPEDDEERAAAAKLSANGAAAQEVQRLLHEKPFLRGADGRATGWRSRSARPSRSAAPSTSARTRGAVAAGANVGLRLGTLLDGVGGGGGGAYGAAAAATRERGARLPVHRLPAELHAAAGGAAATNARRRPARGARALVCRRVRVPAAAAEAARARAPRRVGGGAQAGRRAADGGGGGGAVAPRRRDGERARSAPTTSSARRRRGATS